MDFLALEWGLEVLHAQVGVDREVIHVQVE